jgi:hypothetical protein
VLEKPVEEEQKRESVKTKKVLGEAIKEKASTYTPPTGFPIRFDLASQKEIKSLTGKLSIFNMILT